MRSTKKSQSRAMSCPATQPQHMSEQAQSVADASGGCKPWPNGAFSAIVYRQGGARTRNARVTRDPAPDTALSRPVAPCGVRRQLGQVAGALVAMVQRTSFCVTVAWVAADLVWCASTS